jgi:hypothetical protein
VCGPKFVGDIFEFVNVSTGFKSEGTNEGEWGFFVKDGDGEYFAFCDVVMGEVLFVDADSDGGWFRGDLEEGVCDLTVGFFFVF